MFGAYEVMMTRTFIHSPSAGRSVPPPITTAGLDEYVRQVGRVANRTAKL